jgi:anthranilate phosphoribosyltransferase
VFSLQLARQYGYLYQQTEKDFVILHSTDGYDEVSLTSSFKFFFNGGETLMEPEDLSLPRLTAQDLSGGTTVEESAKIFMKVLEGKGTAAQNAAVIANAGMALFAGHQKEGIPVALAKAKETLESGKALQAFNRLLNN